MRGGHFRNLRFWVVRFRSGDGGKEWGFAFRRRGDFKLKKTPFTYNPFTNPPNLPEVYALTGVQVRDDKSASKAMGVLRDLGVKNAVIKGGHTEHFQGEYSNDWVFLEDAEFILNAKRFNTKNTHGTGCTLSSLIVGLLAQGLDLKNAISKAKELLTIIIQNPLNIGHGHGPLNLWSIKELV